MKFLQQSKIANEKSETLSVRDNANLRNFLTMYIDMPIHNIKRYIMFQLI